MVLQAHLHLLSAHVSSQDMKTSVPTTSEAEWDRIGDAKTAQNPRSCKQLAKASSTLLKHLRLGTT
ncbi:hypothetical protein DCS_00031 [Drechmeria coniospora]|uniref:Uncharacterized protein n=1 Tax=Drechmeria coniospora TaxID=98403 RepID=A0A151GP64_DRECN|nr:hypothetical protein DCS_00031 [Drechmeria coniospora]KYK58904.1 hypothetical protein DCS_00031 [Drechmeria coniospora]